MNRPIVFISGPYQGQSHDGDSYLEIEDNINEARHVAVYLAKKGLGFFCPHLNSAHFEVMAPEATVDYWYDMDISILRGCDAIVLLPTWQSSKGAIAELEEAGKIGLSIFFLPDEMNELVNWYFSESEWGQEHDD